MHTLQVKQLDASIHNSAMTHAGNVFLPRDLDLFITKYMGFQDLWWEICMSSDF